MARPIASPLIVSLSLLLAACAGKPTPYQAAQGGFGYSEQQTEENRYRVSFAGNSASSRQTVEDYLLYRAAELTVQTGHDWFQVFDRNTVQENWQRRIAGVRARGRQWVGRGGRAVFSNVRRGWFRALQCGHGHPGAGRREAAGRPRCLRRLLGDQPAAAKGSRRRRLRGRALPDPSGNNLLRPNRTRSTAVRSLGARPAWWRQIGLAGAFCRRLICAPQISGSLP